MSKTKLASAVLYLVVVAITFGMGIRFLTASEYFAYHADASGVEWAAVDPGLQVVFLAVFKVGGAGFLTVALCLLVMILLSFLMPDPGRSIYAIPACGTLFWSIVLATTVHVTRTTPATAPWIGSLSNVVMIGVAFALSLIDRARLPAEA